jgi:hypothetical protein
MGLKIKTKQCKVVEPRALRKHWPARPSPMHLIHVEKGETLINSHKTAKTLINSHKTAKTLINSHKTFVFSHAQNRERTK